MNLKAYGHFGHVFPDKGSDISGIHGHFMLGLRGRSELAILEGILLIIGNRNTEKLSLSKMVVIISWHDSRHN